MDAEQKFTRKINTYAYNKKKEFLFNIYPRRVKMYRKKKLIFASVVFKNIHLV